MSAFLRWTTRPSAKTELSLLNSQNLAGTFSHGSVLYLPSPGQKFVQLVTVQRQSIFELSPLSLVNQLQLHCTTHHRSHTLESKEQVTDFLHVQSPSLLSTLRDCTMKNFRHPLGGRRKGQDFPSYARQRDACWASESFTVVVICFRSVSYKSQTIRGITKMTSAHFFGFMTPRCHCHKHATFCQFFSVTPPPPPRHW